MTHRRRCFLRHAAWLVTSVGGLAGAAATAAPLQLDLAGAWGGWSRPGRVTEAELLLLSPERTNADVTITAEAQVVRAQVQLAPGEPVRLAVPVPAAERIVATVVPDGMPAQQRELGLSLAETPVLAWVAPAGPPQLVAGFHVVAVDASALPENGAAYASIDALVVDRSVIGTLSERQLSALLSFMASCGRTVLISEAPAPGGMLRGAVGCGGRNFLQAGNADTALLSLGEILESPPADLPHPSAIDALGGHDFGPWSAAGAVLALGLAAIALAAIFSGSLITALLVPALAAAAALLFMQSRPQDPQWLVWAETRGSDGVAQYRGLQRLAASRRGDVELLLPAVLSDPQTCNARGPSAWTWDVAERRYTAARFPGRLFATAALCYAGSFPVTREAIAHEDAAGNVGLRNPGPAAWPAGTLVRDSRVHALPALAPGASIALRTRPGAQPANAVERLAIARTPFDGLGIYWPLDLQSVSQTSRVAQAWLLLQVPIASRAPVQP